MDAVKDNRKWKNSGFSQCFENHKFSQPFEMNSIKGSGGPDAAGGYNCVKLIKIFTVQELSLFYFCTYFLF